jgi:hypothetical protein
LAQNFDLILDVNEPDARTKQLAETARVFGRLLGEQQPVGGMSGALNQTLVRQFRMPGYPLVLVTTDLLQEGEDLHTFCSSVHHYGIGWTPSAMEQRIGRIDRVRSHTERRLLDGKRTVIRGDDMLQVYYPHLEDTVEVLQVRRVLERMNEFLRLMHEGLVVPGQEERSINTAKEFVKGIREVPQIRTRLRTAFPVSADRLRGSKKTLVVTSAVANRHERRFVRIANSELGALRVTWEPISAHGRLLGTARLDERRQPFTLLMHSFDARVLVRCVSPVGVVDVDVEHEEILANVERLPVRIGAIQTTHERTYDLTVEGDVLLGDFEATDLTRVTALVDRIVRQADRLEQQHLPAQDAPLSQFKPELELEAIDGR